MTQNALPPVQSAPQHGGGLTLLDPAQGLDASALIRYAQAIPALFSRKEAKV
jgi:hypothetical protein